MDADDRVAAKVKLGGVCVFAFFLAGLFEGFYKGRFRVQLAKGEFGGSSLCLGVFAQPPLDGGVGEKVGLGQGNKGFVFPEAGGEPGDFGSLDDAFHHFGALAFDAAFCEGRAVEDGLGEEVFLRVIEGFHKFAVSQAVGKVDELALFPEGRDNFHRRYNDGCVRGFFHGVHVQETALLKHSVGAEHPEGEVVFQRQDVLLAVFFPADGIEWLASGHPDGVLMRDPAHVLLHKDQVQEGILHLLHLGGIDGGRIFLEEFVGGFHRRFFHGFVIQRSFAAGLGVEAFGGHRQEEKTRYDGEKDLLLCHRLQR